MKQEQAQKDELKIKKASEELTEEDLKAVTGGKDEKDSNGCGKDCSSD